MAGGGVGPAGSDSLVDVVEQVSAAMTTLRKDVQSLIGPDAGSVGEGVSAAEVGTVLVEAYRLMEKLRPAVAVAREFKWKWAKQKQEILDAKTADIDRAMRRECEAETCRTQAATNEELAALSAENRERCSEATQAFAARHGHALCQAVDAWRRETPEADLVRASTVDDAVRDAVARIARWSEEAERQQVQRWEEDLAALVAAVHRSDRELLMSTSSMHSARCGVLKATLAKQDRELGLQYCELQSSVNNEIRDALEDSKAALKAGVRGHHRRAGPAQRHKHHLLAGIAEQRTAMVHEEVEAAAEAHRNDALQQLDDFAAREHEHLFAFHTAMHEVVPELTRDFERDIRQLCEGSQNDALESTLLPDAVRPLGATPGAGLPGRPPLATGPGHHDVEAGGRVAATSTATKHHASTLSFSDSDAEYSLQSDGPTRRRLVSAGSDTPDEVAYLRAKLAAAEAALARGDWGQSWRASVDDFSRDASSVVACATEALEAQKDIFAAAQLAPTDCLEERAAEHVLGFRHELARIRNMKVALSRARANFLREVAQQQHSAMLAYEDEILTAVSKLAKETETLVEIGHALRGGSDMAPVGIVCGAYRRAAIATLPVLAHIWQETDTPLHEQLQWLARIFDRLARTPSLARVLDDHRGAGHGGAAVAARATGS